MHPGLAASVIVILFASATLYADRFPPGRRWIPIVILAGALGFLFFELARFDHGHTHAFWWMGWIVAPLVLIFGGASWGTRRFYGWPDFGPHPSRAAVVALGILLGVLSGSSAMRRDLRESQEVAVALRPKLIAYRDAHGGVWPASLDLVADPAPSTRMGMLAPPPFRYGLDKQGRAVLAIPVGGLAHVQIDLDAGTWERRRQPPRSMSEVPSRRDGSEKTSSPDTPKNTAGNPEDTRSDPSDRAEDAMSDPSDGAESAPPESAPATGDK